MEVAPSLLWRMQKGKRNLDPERNRNYFSLIIQWTQPLLEAAEWVNSNTNCHFYLVRTVSLKILIPLAWGKFVRLFSCIWMRQISATTHLPCWKSQCCHVNVWNLGGFHLTLPFFFLFGPVEKLMTRIPEPATDTEGSWWKILVFCKFRCCYTKQK